MLNGMTMRPAASDAKRVRDPSGSAHRRHAAFTLVELLVVVAILALLLSLLAPSLRRSKELASRAVCLSRTHALSMGYTNWLSDNKGKAMGYNHTQSTVYWDWSDELAPYVQGSDITFCPKVTGHSPSQLVVGAECLMGGQDFAWQHKPPGGRKAYRGSYGMNQWLLWYETNAWATWLDPDRTMHFATFASINQPSQTPLLGDACWYGGWPKHGDVLPTAAGKPNGQPPTSFQWPWSGSANNMERWAVDRHDLLVCLALTDGSSRPVRIRDLWGLKWNRSFDTTVARPAYP